MKKRFKFLAVACAFALVAAVALVGCGGSNDTKKEDSTSAKSVELTVFAANSLSEAMPEVFAAYTADHPEVTFADGQYLASDDLVASLEGGATADLLVTASKATMDSAVEKELVDESTRVDMFQNQLVIIAAKDSDIAKNADTTPVTIEDIAAGKYTFAIGDENVPAGNYARQALSTVGAVIGYDSNEGKTGKALSGKKDCKYADGLNPHLCAKVGDVAATVGSGDVQVGFVYSSDLIKYADKVVEVGRVPGAGEAFSKIVYPGAVVVSAPNADATKAFLEWCITDPEAQKIWNKWGFEMA